MGSMRNHSIGGKLFGQASFELTSAIGRLTQDDVMNGRKESLVAQFCTAASQLRPETPSKSYA